MTKDAAGNFYGNKAMPFFISSSFTAQYLPILDAEPWPTPEVVRLRESGVRFSLGVSWGLPPGAFARAGRASRKIKTMPDVVEAGSFWAFSEPLREIIEGFEPGVHQFSDEYKVYYKDGRPAEKKYFCINIKPETRNTVIWEQSKVPDI